MCEPAPHAPAFVVTSTASAVAPRDHRGGDFFAPGLFFSYFLFYRSGALGGSAREKEGRVPDLRSIGVRVFADDSQRRHVTDNDALIHLNPKEPHPFWHGLCHACILKDLRAHLKMNVLPFDVITFVSSSCSAHRSLSFLFVLVWTFLLGSVSGFVCSGVLSRTGMDCSRP